MILFPLIYCLDEDDEWTDRTAGSRQSIPEHQHQHELPEGQFKQATNYGSTEEANFKTKHLNEWVSSSDVGQGCRLDGQRIAAIDIDPKELTWYGGLDLASVSDFCCLVWWPRCLMAACSQILLAARISLGAPHGQRGEQHPHGDA